MRQVFGRSWLWLALGALGCSGGGAKTLLETWRETPGTKVVAIYPEEVRGLDWLHRQLGGLPLRAIRPDAYRDAVIEQQEQVLILLRGDYRQIMPAAAFPVVGQALHSVPLDEVAVTARALGAGNWECAVVAPDEQTTSEATLQLLTTEVGHFQQNARSLIRYRLRPALVVASKPEPLVSWLGALGAKTERWRAVPVSAAQVTATSLRAAPMAVIVLTPAIWQTLPATQRELLLEELPATVAQAASRGEVGRVVTASADVRGRLRIAAWLPLERQTATVFPASLASRAAPNPSWDGVRLTGIDAAGGSLAVPDLRQPTDLTLAATGGTPILRGIGDAVVARLRVNLPAATGWQVANDPRSEQELLTAAAAGGAGRLQGWPAARGVAAVLVVQQLTRSTTYLEGTPRILASKGGQPVAFTERAPEPPDPDARLYILIGPKVYPRGKDDPKYQQDYAKFEEAYQAWEKRRDEAAGRNAEVTWEQTLITRQLARAVARLEVYAPSGALQTTLNVAGATVSEQTAPRQTVVKGLGKPAPLALPADQPTADERLIEAAIEDVSTQARDLLPVLAWLPLDPALATPAPTPTPTPTPPTPASGPAVEVSLTVSGFKGVTAASNFTKALQNVEGVTKVVRTSYSKGVLKLGLTVPQTLVEDLPVILESHDALKAFKLTVDDIGDDAITASVP
ncbi:MAG: hypothetical protein IT204_01810 [Fimbriimonadaceae bacterium]|nr:hypothetical protein [Fimbriimonadaceae bacterium]